MEIPPQYRGKDQRLVGIFPEFSENIAPVLEVHL